VSVPHPDTVDVTDVLSPAMLFLQPVCQLEPLGDSVGERWVLTSRCWEGDQAGFDFCKWCSCFVTSPSSLKNLGSGSA